MKLSPGNIGMLVTDLDGTLLGSDRKISSRNLDVLHELGEKGVIRVIASGRSLYSFRRAVPAPDLPIDYLVFSTGAGIVDLSSQELLRKVEMDNALLRNAASILMENDVSFTIQAGLPDNHYFWYYEGDVVPPDYHRRRSAYPGFGTRLNDISEVTAASQLLAILNGGMDEFRDIEKQLSGCRVIRTTSPIDHETVWLEVFPENVSKGQAIRWLAQKRNVSQSDVAAVGNDFNDLAMLEYAGHAFVAANSPRELRQTYHTVGHHDGDLLIDVVQELGI